MPRQPDLTLPARIPEVEWHRHERGNDLPFALYALCDIDNEALEMIRRLCTTDTGDDTVKIAPRAMFPTQSLHSILEYHIELAKQEEFDWKYFIVCIYAESWTVLLVTLDGDDKITCVPDSMWMNADMAGTVLVNASMSNVDWIEWKEEAADGPLFEEPTRFFARDNL